YCHSHARHMFCLFIHPLSALSFFFFFNDTATPEIYPLSLHDALPISLESTPRCACLRGPAGMSHPLRALSRGRPSVWWHRRTLRSEEHTSELQSLTNLVCRLLLEKKKNKLDTLSTYHTE